MPMFDQTPFSKDTNVEAIPIGQMVRWFTSSDGAKLRLPPIQRSLVWSNEQILNYWDSLMRGYPAGLMLVHKAFGNVGRNAEGRTETLSDTDYQLFDGQQRLSAVLLGFGQGPIAETRKLWIDLSSGGTGDRKYSLRVNSTGQPFGYRADLPNQKPELRLRAELLGKWRSDHPDGVLTPTQIFMEMANKDSARLIGAPHVISLASFLRAIKTGTEGLFIDQVAQIQPAKRQEVAGLIDSLKAALDVPVILQRVDGGVLDEEEYARFFQRLGQGGTRLSDDEMVYSLVKQRYPYIHDRLRGIVEDSGKLASEVDLVLAALRIAKMLRPWQNASEWEIVGRPTTDLLKRFKKEPARFRATERLFLDLLPEEATVPSGLASALGKVRDALLYTRDTNPLGLPPMLLARLPRNLLDVLLLLAVQHSSVTRWDEQDRAAVIAFTMYWLFFVDKDDKAAARCYSYCGKADWQLSRANMVSLVATLEAEKISRTLPNLEQWSALEDQVQQRGSKLASWGRRFDAVDDKEGSTPGESLRVLSTHGELIRRALMWLQRSYIAERFPNYDPTSARDDDLPVDLDHIIPQKHFDFMWADEKVANVDAEVRNAFRWERRNIGNSLGNFRWLAVSDNRGRGEGLIEPEQDIPLDDDLVRGEWNTLIEGLSQPKRAWISAEIDTFQRLIDARTLRLAKRLINGSGIAILLNNAAPVD